MMEAASTSEIMVNFYQTTWHSNPEDSHLRTCHHENLESHFEDPVFLYIKIKLDLTFGGLGRVPAQCNVARVLAVGH
jgi:hypothetical protein